MLCTLALVLRIPPELLASANSPLRTVRLAAHAGGSAPGGDDPDFATDADIAP
ncbi:hypothetical protein ACWCPQ_17405 [Nocardia sp. NPDC001965]